MSKLKSFEEVVELAETMAVDWNIFENEKAVMDYFTVETFKSMGVDFDDEDMGYDEEDVLAAGDFGVRFWEENVKPNIILKKAVENDTYSLGGKRKTDADFEIERVCNNYILSAEEQDAALSLVGVDGFDFYGYEYAKAKLDMYKIEIDALLDLDKYYTKAENILRGRKIEIELTDTILAHDDLLRSYFWKTKIDWGW